MLSKIIISISIAAFVYFAVRDHRCNVLNRMPVGGDGTNIGYSGMCKNDRRRSDAVMMGWCTVLFFIGVVV